MSFLLGSRAALLADEMGLGKTVQTIVALSLLLDEGETIRRALIVAPASLTLNWMSELAAWAPEVAARRVVGDVEDRAAYYMLPVPVLVASYEQVREDAVGRIPRQACDLVVLDEAQRVKNAESATALACRLLPRKRAWALSATPLENELRDLESILSFLDGEIGARRTRAGMARQLGSMMLRRRKRDVRRELPPVIIQDLRVELTGEQREGYDELWATRRTRVVAAEGQELSGSAMLGVITRLKGICNIDSGSGASAKMEALRTIVEGAGNAAKIVVFSQFVETLRWVSRRLNLRHGLLVGSMTMEEREMAMSEFRAGEPPVGLLVSLRAGGLGLNLGEATHVVLFDRWWNPAVEVQAVYRAHRFEREEPLHVIRFLVRDSIEERIAAILSRKEALFAETVESRPGEGPSGRDLVEILDLGGGGGASRPS